MANRKKVPQRVSIEDGDILPKNFLFGSATIIAVCKFYNITEEQVYETLESKGINQRDVFDRIALNVITNSFKRTIKTKYVTLDKPRAAIVCKTYNISFGTLKQFLSDNNIEVKGYHATIPNSVVQLVSETFDKDRLLKNKLNGRNIIVEIKSGEPIDEAQNSEVTLLKTDFFIQHKQYITYKEYPIISSNFTDIEAINICEKMSSPYTRNLCASIAKTSEKEAAFLMYQIHFIANKALSIFGGKMLSFIYELRPLKFQDKDAKEIVTYNKVVPDFPILVFKTEDASYRICFFIKHDRVKENFISDMRISIDEHEEFETIDEDGKIKLRLDKYKPTLSLFYKLSTERNYEIFSGVESGRCVICQNKLTDPISLRIGVGPYCARKLNLDSSIYPS